MSQRSLRNRRVRSRGALCAGIVVVAIATATPGVSIGQALEPAPQDPFTMLFAKTCMKHYKSPDALRAMLAEWGAPELSGDDAKPFLSNDNGSAWALVRAGVRYAVSLRSNGICSVFAQRADVAAVQQHFIALVSTSPAPLKAREFPAEGSGPNRGAVRTISYGWSRDGDASELVFTLTTSSEAAPRIQAMAPMAEVAKSP